MVPWDTVVAWVQPWLVVCRLEASPRVVSAAWLVLARPPRQSAACWIACAALASCFSFVRADIALAVPRALRQ